MLKPDYHNSIVNLVASLSNALGVGAEKYEPLALLEGLKLSDRPLILLIVDGLGDNFLQRHRHSFLYRHRCGRLSSVFPPTTATAITSFFTGVGPQQHGITGWYTYFRELGTVVTVLPFIPRYGGASFEEADISPAQLVVQGSLLNKLALPSHVILPQHLIDSSYSCFLSGRATRHGYKSLPEMFACIEKLANLDSSGLVIAYWAGLDSYAHEHGIDSPEVEALFRELDLGCQKTLSLLAERGHRIIISSDHGLIDCPEDKAIHLDEHPRLASMLTLPLCGEPRCAYCYVRSDRREEFERYITEELSLACELKKSREMISEGFFGLGQPARQLEERVGEYVLLMRDKYTLQDRILSEKRYRLHGVHGGLSEEELYVPLILI